MVTPSLNNLMEEEKINKYALVIATAKAAKDITDQYVVRREFAEKHAGKDDKLAAEIVNEKYRDEKAVQNAVEELYDGEYRIVKDSVPDFLKK